MPSPQADHHCATTGRRTDRSVISNTHSMFMIGKGTPAPHLAAPARYAGSCRLDALHSIAPLARTDPHCPPAQTQTESLQVVYVVEKLLYKPPRLRWPMDACWLR